MAGLGSAGQGRARQGKGAMRIKTERNEMTKIFFGGVPTDADVRKLEDAFGVPEIGTEIPHEDVESVLGLNRKQSRYITVTGAWRKRMATTHNVEIAAIPKVGFKCLSDKERIEFGMKGFQSGMRKQGRSVRKVSHVRTEDPVLLKTQDVMRRYHIAMTQQAASMMKEIEPPSAVSRLPRRVA